MILFAFIEFTQTVFVDRIEEDFAIIEWENEDHSIIPLDRFNVIPKEGAEYKIMMYQPTNYRHLISYRMELSKPCPRPPSLDNDNVYSR